MEWLVSTVDILIIWLYYSIYSQSSLQTTYQNIIMFCTTLNLFLPLQKHVEIQAEIKFIKTFVVSSADWQAEKDDRDSKLLPTLVR